MQSKGVRVHLQLVVDQDQQVQKGMTEELVVDQQDIISVTVRNVLASNSSSKSSLQRVENPGSLLASSVSTVAVMCNNKILSECFSTYFKILF